MAVKIELNTEGVKALLKSSQMEKALMTVVKGIAERAGEGYDYDTYMAGTRVIASAYTEKSSEGNALLRALK